MGTSLASVMTTPTDPNKKRQDVVIKMVKLASYQINLRSFHPNTQFEAKGFFFHGDNRGFSLGKSFFIENDETTVVPQDGVTSRVWSQSNVNLAQINQSQSLPKPIVESNPSGPLRIAGVPILGHDEDYSDEKYKPSGEIQVIVPDVKFESPRSFNFTSHYHGKTMLF